MLTYALTLAFTSPFIGNPYWPEMFELIEITKKSGMNRARATQNARKALEEELRQRGMTLADFEELKARAERPFHMMGGKIIIPADYVLAFLVAANDEARAAQRACQPNQVRARIVASHFVTDKESADGIWQRFATVTAGTGAELSNQRAMRSNAYIEDFSATGTLSFDPNFVNPDALRNLIDWGGAFVGIGASRKMGKGRFRIAAWEKVSDMPIAAE